MPATNELLQEGRYRISQSSTHAGDDKTFEAYDTVRNTPVIVREIPVKLNKVTTVSQRESLQLAFANQAKALTEIEHESLVHVQDYFAEIDRQYLVMEAIEGENLGRLLASKKKAFAVNEVMNWADQLLDALSYLHSRKPAIIHRNIHPSNVILDPSGKIKLIGMGVENGADPEFASSSPADGDDLRYSPMEHIWPGLDAASQKVITNSYDDRSERILKQPLDERSDIYSLGATLYYFVTGIEPVDPIERSIEILEGKLDPLREPTKVQSNIPAEISDVLMKALEIKRENRYDSAVIMRQVLKTVLDRVADQQSDEHREQDEAAEIIRKAAQAKAESAAAEEAKRAVEADAKRREAEAAEKKRLEAEAAEKKRLEAEAADKLRREAEAAEQKRREAEAEQARQRELMQAQLQKAEEERLLAERAEADRLLREANEADAAKDDSESSPVVDDLLEIPVSAEVVAYRDTTAVEEDELAAVLRELEEVDAETSATESIAAADVITYDTPVDLDVQSSNAVDDDDDIFSVPQKSGSSLPIPAIAGGVVLVVVLAIGAWFMMSGSTEQPKVAPAPVVVETTQPAPVEAAPAADTIVSSASDTNTTPAESSTEPSAASAAVETSKAAPTPKPKKETAKAAPEKKKVTVDDLINDN